MLESYKWMGWDGMGWKSLQALILRAPLCGANKIEYKMEKVQHGKAGDMRAIFSQWGKLEWQECFKYFKSSDIVCKI